VLAKLTVNLPSQAGREDWQPVKLIVNRQHLHRAQVQVSSIVNRQL
jgi:hypothetical protein